MKPIRIYLVTASAVATEGEDLRIVGAKFRKEDAEKLAAGYKANFVDPSAVTMDIEELGVD